MLSSHEVPRQVLIVDDHRPIHDDFRRILSADPLSERLDSLESQLFQTPVAPSRSVKYQLHNAFQGEDAYHLVRERAGEGTPIDIAFVDMRMPPGWDGIETIDHLWEVDPDLHIVICTAYSDYSWPEISDHFGCRDNLLILRKPFDNLEVLQIAAALTEKRRLADIVRRKCLEMESTIRRRVDELSTKDSVLRHRQRLESIGLMAAGVSHEFRRVTKDIVRSLGLALALDNLGSKVAGFLHEAMDAASQGAASATQLRDYCRPRYTKHEPIELAQLVREFVAMTRPFVQESIRFELRELNSRVVVDADRVSMLQVLVNLINNARDAMPTGGVITLEVDVIQSASLAGSSLVRSRRQELPDSLATLRVSDTGHGIPSNLRNRVFEPFFTTKEYGNRSGLGLSTVNGIVREHNGWIEFESDGATGTSFVIYLPVRNVEGENAITSGAESVTSQAFA